MRPPWTWAAVSHPAFSMAARSAVLDFHETPEKPADR
jgi:hypothetical protein